MAHPRIGFKQKVKSNDRAAEQSMISFSLNVLF